MDNTTILFNAIQRTYRNAIVAHIRSHLTDRLGSAGIEAVKKCFGKRNEQTGKTHWESISDAAKERRSGGTGELSTPIRDEYDLLGVEFFYNVFEAHFDVLCPAHSHKPNKERNQACQTLLTWMKQIKNYRDPVSHPVSEDIDYSEATNVLYCARKALDFCGLAEDSAQLLRLQTRLLGGYVGEPSRVLCEMPPEDEVVMAFVGRHRELGLLTQWISSGISKRWALSGEGGKGKSAIAYAFGRNLSERDDHGLDAVMWMSAKRRRFVEGTTVLVDRPDFHDKASAISAIIRLFGEGDSIDEDAGKEDYALQLLSEFPSLLIVDDIDTVEEDGEDAIQFLVMTVPERTKSKVLITSRKAIFGLSNVTTQVLGLSPSDASDFIKSRCDLMGIPVQPVLSVQQKLLDVTDSSPLFIEDLLRLHQTGISIEKAIGLWAEKRGTEARKYAIQREYDQLDDDAKSMLLALSIHGPSDADELCRGLDWQQERLVTALQQLRKMFLLPITGPSSVSSPKLALNRNTQILVKEVLGDSEAFRRTERLMKAATGQLKTKKSEDERVDKLLRRARLLVNQSRADDAEAEAHRVISEFPGRSDGFATLAWIQKKQGDNASARMNFQRAHDLGCSDRDAYGHWADMEASNEEWGAAAQAAELGMSKFGESQGLLFRIGYARHRQGRELIREGEVEAGRKHCKQAEEFLERARTKNDSEPRNYSIRFQIYRAIALNFEALDEGARLARHFALWQNACPNDSQCESEYQRLRGKYAKYLSSR